MSNPPSISPEMKVGELLDAFPALEKTLMAIAPEFSKLRNPILRRTVAKVASLDQAARIAGLDVGELVRRLRMAAGQPVAEPTANPAEAGSHAEGANTPAGRPRIDAGPPPWLDPARVDPPFNADAVLEAGGHPLGLVRQRLRQLEPGRIFCIVSTFRPVPIFDALTSEGYACFMAEENGEIRTYITHAQGV